MYDILPPKLANKVQETVKELGATQKPRRRTAKSAGAPKQPKIQPKITKPKERRFPLKELLIGGGVILLLLGVYLFTTLPKADIQIMPKTEAFQEQQKLVADKTVTTADYTQKAIPARYLEETKDATQQFPATGTASNDGKATGTIRVYNKISPSTPLVLKAGTHFLSDSGKYFVSLDKITVPAAQGGTAGSVTVRVQAESAGSDYNIGASKFSVPKLSGTAYYYSIWAESTAAMAGGHTGSVKQVTDNDLASAKDALVKNTLAQAEASLRSKLSSDDILLDNAILRTTISATADAKSGAIAENFNQSASVKVSALVFKKQDVDAFIKQALENDVTDGKSYLEKSLKVAYAADFVDVKNGIIKLTATATVDTYNSIHINDIIDQIPGKNASQIQQVIAAKYPNMVSDVKVHFWPFWVSKAPGNKNKITINLVFP